MQQSVTIQGPDAERMQELLQRLKQDIAQFEAILAVLRQPPAPAVEEDIFAEMAGVTANAPDADDSREAIYTRMPGE